MANQVKAVAAAVAAAVAGTVKEITENDKAFGDFLDLAIVKQYKAAKAHDAANNNLWGGTVTHIAVNKATWEGAEAHKPGILKKGTLSSIKTTITKALAAGVALLDEKQEPRGKSRVELETKAKGLDVSLTDENGKEKTIKALRDDCKEAATDDGSGNTDTGNKGETVGATPEQIVRAALTFMKTEPEIFLYPHKAEIAELVRLIDAATIAKRKKTGTHG